MTLEEEILDADLVQVPRVLLATYLKETKPRFERWNMAESITAQRRYLALRRFVKKRTTASSVDASALPDMLAAPTPLPWTLRLRDTQRGPMPVIEHHTRMTPIPVALVWQAADAVRIIRAMNATKEVEVQLAEAESSLFNLTHWIKEYAKENGVDLTYSVVIAEADRVLSKALTLPKASP